MTTSTLVPCEWCGATHQTKCPLVKAIEYHENGRIRRVEFMTANDYPPPNFGAIGPNYATSFAVPFAAQDYDVQEYEMPGTKCWTFTPKANQ